MGSRTDMISMHDQYAVSEGIRSSAILEPKKFMYWYQDQYGFDLGLRRDGHK